MKAQAGSQIREAGYEVLYALGGFLALSIHPTLRNLDDILRWIDESHGRREVLQRLASRGLVQFGDRDGQWVPRLTEAGRSAFAGGRHPEIAWRRRWDKQWRLLTFDLPRDQSAARMKLRRWLCQNHFGKLQGSVWIHPDRVEGIDGLLSGSRIDPAAMMIFEGAPVGSGSSREIAGTAWDFEAIDRKYAEYARFAERTLRQLSKTSLSGSRVRGVLREDRQRWWAAICEDPLLPKSLHPKGYEGPGAWKLRCRLLKSLCPPGAPGKDA